MVEGKVVRLSFDQRKRDDYGRLLAQVYLRDGRWVNGLLVQKGLAYVYTFSPNFRWAAPLLRLERQARAANLGIWSIPRFRILRAEEVRRQHVGQFRLVRGRVQWIDRKHRTFRIGRLIVSIPRRHLPYFPHRLKLRKGQEVIVRGVVCISKDGTLYLPLHTPFDLEETMNATAYHAPKMVAMHGCEKDEMLKG